MIAIVKKGIALSALTILSLISQAQKKDLTDEQYFKVNFKGMCGINYIS